MKKYLDLPFRRPFNSPEALQKAKRAVEENYAVVGVLEDLNTTLTVLEHYVPRFFRGVSQVYHGLCLKSFLFLSLIVMWLMFNSLFFFSLFLFSQSLFTLFLYHSNGAASESVRINRNAFKPPVSDYVKDIVRRNFSREMEFYEFCKDRLYKQYRALKLPRSKSNDASVDAHYWMWLTNNKGWLKWH